MRLAFWLWGGNRYFATKMADWPAASHGGGGFITYPAFVQVLMAELAAIIGHALDWDNGPEVAIGFTKLDIW